jgi:hypothetical protein
MTLITENKREYNSWLAMRHRCRNPKLKWFCNYGGRGIEVCDRWYDSFETFLDDMGKRPDGHSLERIDNDGNYEPGNCRWATRAEQSANQRPRKKKIIIRVKRARSKTRVGSGPKTTNANVFTYNGESLTLPQWAKRLGLTRSALHGRIKRGYTIEEAITMSKMDRGRKSFH